MMKRWEVAGSWLKTPKPVTFEGPSTVRHWAGRLTCSVHITQTKVKFWPVMIPVPLQHTASSMNILHWGGEVWLLQLVGEPGGCAAKLVAAPVGPEAPQEHMEGLLLPSP